MSNFSQSEFNQFILQNHIIGFFEKPITLKSGRLSNWYVNWRTVTEDVYASDQLSNFITSFIIKLLDEHSLATRPTCFYGVPEGATKIALLTQYKNAIAADNYGPGSHIFPMGRAKPKEHGVAKDRFFLGMPTGNTVVIEDVTTTGASLLNTIDVLTSAEIPVVAALGLTNRMEKRDDGLSVAEAIAQKTSNGQPIKYFQMSSAVDLLPAAYKQLAPGEKIAQALEQEFEQFGVERLAIPR